MGVDRRGGSGISADKCELRRRCHTPRVDDLRLGAIIRAVRKRRRLTQADLAGLAGVSHSTVSLVERGHCENLSLRRIRSIAASLEVRVELQGRWRGGEVDRLLCRRHSMLGERFATFVLTHDGWAIEPEVSFSVFGERGVIDQLGWHAETAHLLVVELKTALVDVNELLGTLDRKCRLARTIAAERGWPAAAVSVWLIVDDTKTNRRHVAEHRTLLRTRLPLDGRQFRTFLDQPTTATAGLAFWTNATPRSTRANLPIRRDAGAPLRTTAGDQSSVGRAPASGPGRKTTP